MESIEREYIRSLKIGYKENMLSNIQGTISEIITAVGNIALLYVGIMQVCFLQALFAENCKIKM